MKALQILFALSFVVATVFSEESTHSFLRGAVDSAQTEIKKFIEDTILDVFPTTEAQTVVNSFLDQLKARVQPEVLRKALSDLSEHGFQFETISIPLDGHQLEEVVKETIELLHSPMSLFHEQEGIESAFSSIVEPIQMFPNIVSKPLQDIAKTIPLNVGVGPFKVATRSGMGSE